MCAYKYRKTRFFNLNEIFTTTQLKSLNLINHFSNNKKSRMLLKIPYNPGTQLARGKFYKQIHKQTIYNEMHVNKKFEYFCDRKRQKMSKSNHRDTMESNLDGLLEYWYHVYWIFGVLCCFCVWHGSLLKLVSFNHSLLSRFLSPYASSQPFHCRLFRKSPIIFANKYFTLCV